MAGIFDFEHYYTDKVIKTDIKLDISNLPVKGSASSSVMNEDGTVDEVNMNEIVTNNVMYRISSLTPSGSGALGINDRIALTVSDNNTGRNESTTYIALGYPLDDVASSGIYDIPETRALIPTLTFKVGDVYGPTDRKLIRITVLKGDDMTGSTVTSFSMNVTPRMRWINPSLNIGLSPTSSVYRIVNQNFWHQTTNMAGFDSYVNTSRALAACGLQGNLYKGMKWYNKQEKGKTRAVYWYDSFVKTIKSLGKEAKDNNLGMKVTFFDRSYSETRPQGEDESDKDYNAWLDSVACDWTQTEIKFNAKMKDVYLSSSPGERNDTPKVFFDECKRHDPPPLDDISIDSATAIIPNVADVFKKLYTPKEELADDFTDAFFETYNSIMDINGVRPFMSSSLKNKLDKAKTMLKKTGSGTPNWLLDLSSCMNLAKTCVNDKSRPNDDVDYLQTTFYPNYTDGVRMVQEWGTKILYCAGYSNDKEKRYVDTFDARTDSRTALTYETAKDSQYTDWVKRYRKMTVAEIKSVLCEYFTSAVNDANGTEPGDNGYVKFIYNPDDHNYYEIVHYGNKEYEIKIPGSSDGDNRITPKSTDYFKNLAKNNQTTGEFSGSSRMFIRKVFNDVSSLTKAIAKPTSDHYYDYAGTSLMEQDDMTFNVVSWDEASTSIDNIVNRNQFVPTYATLDDLGESTTYSINDCVEFARDVMKEAISEIDTILAVQGITLGMSFLILNRMRLNEAKDNYRELMDVLNRILWYQKFTNESVFDNKTFASDDDNNGRPNANTCPYLFMPARFLVPVHMYKRVRVRYKRWGRTRHKTVKRSIGVRWCEVLFVDNDVYEAYPQNSDEPMQYYPIQSTARVTTTSNKQTFVFDSPIEGDTSDKITIGDVTQFNEGILVIGSQDGYRSDVTFNDATTFTSKSPIQGLGSQVFVAGIYVPLENTAKSDERTNVRVEYKMPYIPYDSELRRWAFMTYGAFDQDKYASESRELPAPPDKEPGWTIFKNSSKRIGDLRAQMGIYDAVAILMGILRNTFGASNVELVETMRSKDDQELMCSGGGESTFLSWHNYGLAVKILINNSSTGLPIEDGSPEFMKLIDVAEGFTTACFNGAFGKPLNVIWCGRLKIGANNFVWEFLPIGVNHKDAIKFREAILNQEDPVASLGFVNVDANRYAFNTKPRVRVPYILRSSSAYKNAIIINGEHYVSPASIRNYNTPHDLVLINILEFCNLISTKMQANGSSLKEGRTIYEWKALNERSYKQLLIYYGLTGSISAAKALVCGDYVESYKDTVERKYSEDCVQMVKDYLGNLYGDARIYVAEAADGGAWFSLSDGKLHLKTTDIRPIYDERSKDHFYGQKVAPVECTERGLYIGGVFRTEQELKDMGYPIETVSDVSYIEGFDDNGNVVGDDALFLHSLVATQIKEEFDKLRELFENYGGGLMYDHFADGPNMSMADGIENEFGIIAGQDLIGFDNLRAIFAQKSIEDNARRNSDGSIQGAGGAESTEDASSESGRSDIFEKVVSNAELSGVRKASLTREHINVTVTPSNMTTEQLYKLIMKGSMTQANDMFSK